MIAQVRNALNASGIQKTNPSLYSCISSLIDNLASEAIEDELIVASGSGYTKSTDTNGTRINFGKNFTTDIVVVACVRDTSLKGFCTIVTKANSYFQVKAFDDTGTRISAAIEWIARGTLQ